VNTSQIYDVIVVGAGLAGLSSAAFLSREGIRTLVCERGANYGGLVNSFEREGFVFDGGIRAFENSGILVPMLRQLGIDLPMCKNPVTIGIGDDRIVLESRANLADYRMLLERNFPESKADIARIVASIEETMGYMDILYGIDNPLFLDSYGDTRYLFDTLLPWLAKYRKTLRHIGKMQQPIYEFLGTMTSNGELVDCIAQHFFKKTPAFFAMSYFGLYLDYCYPKGGTGVLAEKLSTYVLEWGGLIEFDTEVRSIDVSEKVVVTKDGRTFSYKKLIWAADMKALYRSVRLPTIESERRRNIIEDRRSLVEHSHGGDSILGIYYATTFDRESMQRHCGAHLFYTPLKKGLQSIGPDRWKAIVADRRIGEKSRKWKLKSYLKDFFSCTTFEISCPALRDPSLAPPGKSGLIASTLFEYDLAKAIKEAGWYEEFKEFCTDTVARILGSRLLPGFGDHLLFSSCATPLTIENLTGNSEGAITGWAFTDGEIPSEKRFGSIAKSVRTPIPNVYQAGQWVFSPSGLPVSALTGKLASREVLKKLKK
jgi:phytoene dehydrogenase-like protein